MKVHFDIKHLHGVGDDLTVGGAECSGTVTVDISDEAAQQLLDELWRLGVRPTEIGSQGHIATMNRHLEDMRAIAFHNLNVPKP